MPESTLLCAVARMRASKQNKPTYPQER